MYKELEAEIVRKGLSKRKVSDMTGIRYETLLVKLSGKFSFTLDEAFKIKMAIESDKPIEVLFFK
ncbi:hypothetical protein [Veillonella sp.]|uniref:hypothetical protein n=1 Tax=Veillonella sp. TaxID=1926307 RepID=UPI0025D0412B|nr:hypothetical protein [Veillonella sp.]